MAAFLIRAYHEYSSRNTNNINITIAFLTHTKYLSLIKKPTIALLYLYVNSKTIFVNREHTINFPKNFSAVTFGTYRCADTLLVRYYVVNRNRVVRMKTNYLKITFGIVHRAHPIYYCRGKMTGT
jgi:hypothetical protein